MPGPANFRAILHAHQDPVFINQPGKWADFLSQLVAAYEKDNDELARAIRIERSEYGLAAKDIKPMKFESATKTPVSFKQWSGDMLAWTKNIKRKYSDLLKATADLEEWSEVAFKTKLHMLNVTTEEYPDLDEDVLSLLRNITDGDARDMIDAASCAGEAWWRICDRFHPKTAQGATAVADKIQSTKRLTSINEAQNKLTVLKKLLKEFDRQSEEKLPQAIVKSALVRILPESFHKTLTANMTIDKVTVTTLEDRLVQIIRDNSSGPAPMDMSNLENDGDRQSTQDEKQSEKDDASQWQPDGQQWWPTGSEGEGAGAYSLQKGKAKGKGSGCAICGAMDHWKNECPKNKGGKSKGWNPKGKGKGKYGKGKGYYGKGFGASKGGKGWGKGAYNLESGSDYGSGWEGDWSGGWGSVPALVLEKGRKDDNDDDPEKTITWAEDLIADNTEPLDEKLSREIAAGEWKVPVKTAKAKNMKREPPAFARLIPDTVNNSELHNPFIPEPPVHTMPIFHDTIDRNFHDFHFQFSGASNFQSDSFESSVQHASANQVEVAKSQWPKLTGSWDIFQKEGPDIAEKEREEEIRGEEMEVPEPPPVKTIAREERKTKKKKAAPSKSMGKRAHFATEFGFEKGQCSDACCAARPAEAEEEDDATEDGPDHDLADGDGEEHAPVIEKQPEKISTNDSASSGSSAESSLTAEDGRRVVQDEDADKGNRRSRNPVQPDGSPPTAPVAKEETRKGRNLGQLPACLFELNRGKDINDIEQSDWRPRPKPLVVDSGAGETVMPKDWCVAHPIRDSPGSLAEDFYTTANGTKVYNEGQREMYLATLDGKSLRKMTFQVGKVSKALGSVSQMVDNGNRVVFELDQNGYDISYIENKDSREKIWLRRENGVYVLDMMVAPPSFNHKTEQPGFPRPGAR